MAEGERIGFRTAADMLIIDGANILMGRRKNTGWCDGMYGIPGGHLEHGETLRQTAAREALEEHGIIVRPEDIAFVHAMHHRSEHMYIQFFFKATAWSGTPIIGEPALCDDVRWFPLDQLPENTVPSIRHALECIKQEIPYSEFGW